MACKNTHTHHIQTHTNTHSTLLFYWLPISILCSISLSTCSMSLFPLSTPRALFLHSHPLLFSPSHPLLIVCSHLPVHPPLPIPSVYLSISLTSWFLPCSLPSWFLPFTPNPFSTLPFPRSPTLTSAALSFCSPWSCPPPPPPLSFIGSPAPAPFHSFVLPCSLTLSLFVIYSYLPCFLSHVHRLSLLSLEFSLISLGLSPSLNIVSFFCNLATSPSVPSPHSYSPILFSYRTPPLVISLFPSPVLSFFCTHPHSFHLPYSLVLAPTLIYPIIFWAFSCCNAAPPPPKKKKKKKKNTHNSLLRLLLPYPTPTPTLHPLTLSLPLSLSPLLSPIILSPACTLSSEIPWWPKHIHHQADNLSLWGIFEQQ